MTKSLLTLKRIKDASPCETSWVKLLTSLGKTKADNEPITFRQVITACGFSDALWCFRVINSPQIVGEFTLKIAVRAAKHQDTIKAKRCRKVHRAFLRGKATRDELISAAAATFGVAAYADISAAYAAAAACAAADAAYADTATYAAAACAACAADADAAERKWQANLIIKMFD